MNAVCQLGCHGGGLARMSRMPHVDSCFHATSSALRSGAPASGAYRVKENCSIDQKGNWPMSTHKKIHLEQPALPGSAWSGWLPCSGCGTGPPAAVTTSHAAPAQRRLEGSLPAAAFQCEKPLVLFGKAIASTPFTPKKASKSKAFSFANSSFIFFSDVNDHRCGGQVSSLLPPPMQSPPAYENWS